MYRSGDQSLSGAHIRTVLLNSQCVYKTFDSADSPLWRVVKIVSISWRKFVEA